MRWNTGINISSNRNRVLSLGNIDRLGYRTTQGGYSVNDPFMYLIVGKSFGQIYGYGYEGTWKTSEAKQAADYGELPGDRKFTDVNNDGVINKQDLKVIGNAFLILFLVGTTASLIITSNLIFLSREQRGMIYLIWEEFVWKTRAKEPVLHC